MQILLTTPFDNGAFDNSIGNYTHVRVKSFEEDRSDKSIVVLLQWGIWSSPTFSTGIKTERRTLTDAVFLASYFQITLTAAKAQTPTTVDSDFIGENLHKVILTKIQADAVTLADASLIGTVAVGGF